MKAIANIYLEKPMKGSYIFQQKLNEKDIDDIITKVYLNMKENINIKKIEIEPVLDNGRKLQIMTFPRKIKIKANVWGGQEEVTLTTWEEIKKLGFKKRDRAFGTLNDGTQALYFNGCGRLANNGKDEWFLTTEKLEDIRD